MKPRKAAVLAAEAVRSGDSVVIVFPLRGKTIWGKVTDVASNCEPMGPVGDQVAGPLSVHLSIEVTG